MGMLPSFGLGLTGGNAGPSGAYDFGTTIAPVTVIGGQDENAELQSIFAGQNQLIETAGNSTNVMASTLQLHTPTQLTGNTSNDVGSTGSSGNANSLLLLAGAAVVLWLLIR